MAIRDPLKLPEFGKRKFDNFHDAFAEFAKHPPIGLTQGGSSRKFPGAKSAARDANVQKDKHNVGN